jgi:hypothetical protein
MTSDNCRYDPNHNKNKTRIGEEKISLYFEEWVLN